MFVLTVVRTKETIFYVKETKTNKLYLNFYFEHLIDEVLLKS